MAQDTGISWTRSTFNPWIGCTKVGPGCDACYAEALDARHRWRGATHWGAGVPRMRTSAAIWHNPVKWNRCANDEKARGEKWMGREGFWPVFCASLADVFDNEVDDAWRIDLWALIIDTPHLTWQLVTKRVGNVMKMVPKAWTESGFPPNIWIVSTMVNQVEFDRDIDKLIEIPAKVRGLSIEPQLGPIDFGTQFYKVRGNLHWAIFGGESAQSGHKPRPCAVEWIREGVVQCRVLGIAPFVKQLGSKVFEGGVQTVYTGKAKDMDEWPTDLRVQEFPT